MYFYFFYKFLVHRFIQTELTYAKWGVKSLSTGAIRAGRISGINVIKKSLDFFINYKLKVQKFRSSKVQKLKCFIVY